MKKRPSKPNVNNAQPNCNSLKVEQKSNNRGLFIMYMLYFFSRNTRKKIIFFFSKIHFLIKKHTQRIADSSGEKHKLTCSHSLSELQTNSFVNYEHLWLADIIDEIKIVCDEKTLEVICDTDGIYVSNAYVNIQVAITAIALRKLQERVIVLADKQSVSSNITKTFKIQHIEHLSDIESDFFVKMPVRCLVNSSCSLTNVDENSVIHPLAARFPHSETLFANVVLEKNLKYTVQFALAER